MIKFMNVDCITEKEASSRYGYSVFWFQQIRRKEGPPFYQIKKKGRVLYPVNDCDDWFNKRMMDKE